MKYIVILSILVNFVVAYDTRSNAEFLNDRYNVVKQRVNEDMYQNNPRTYFVIMILFEE